MTSPGWFPSPYGDNVLRWWNGTEWTSDTSPMIEPTSSMSEPTPDRRAIAAVAHLGVPLFSVFLPLAVWASSPPGSLARAHGSQAFSFQAAFLTLWIVLVGGMAAGIVSPTILLIVIGSAFVLELPQVLLALIGRSPARLIPIRLLPR